MRVQLVKPPTSVEPTGGRASATAGHPVQAISDNRSLLHKVTSLSVILPVALLCLGVVGWSLFIRLPGTRGLLTANARTLQTIEPAGPPTHVEELAQLEQQAGRASAALVQKREDLGPLLFDLETAARRLGWRVEVSMKPAVPRPGGLKKLSLHPVTFKLADEAEHTEPAYQRLLQWLRAVSSNPIRAEVVGLRLRAAGAGLGAVEADLQLFSINSHEEAAPK